MLSVFLDSVADLYHRKYAAESTFFVHVFLVSGPGRTHVLH